MTLRTVTVRNLITGESFPHPSYTASDDESLAFARLTFNARCFECSVARPVVPVVPLPVRPSPFKPLQQTSLF